MEFCGAKAKTIIQVPSYGSFSIFHARRDFCEKHIMVTKTCVAFCHLCEHASFCFVYHAAMFINSGHRYKSYDCIVLWPLICN